VTNLDTTALEPVVLQLRSYKALTTSIDTTGLFPVVLQLSS
jgi:hypothetical protein